MITEIVFYRTLPHVSPEEHESAARSAQEAFLEGRPGFLERILGPVEGEEGAWADVVRWSSVRELELAMSAAPGVPEMGVWMSQMDPDSVRMTTVQGRLRTASGEG
jgi:hypothetical protein